MLGVRQRCANRTRDGRIPRIYAPKKSSAPCSIYWCFVSCSNDCDLQEASSSWVGWVQVKSVELRWKHRQYALGKVVSAVVDASGLRFLLHIRCIWLGLRRQQTQVYMHTCVSLSMYVRWIPIYPLPVYIHIKIKVNIHTHIQIQHTRTNKIIPELRRSSSRRQVLISTLPTE